MALIKNANAGTIARDAIVLDLGQIAQEGERLRARAEAQAERIVEQAREEREKLISDAHAVGFEDGKSQGIDAGLEQGRTEGRAEALASQQDRLDALARAMQSALDEFETMRGDLADHAREDVLRFAITLAQRVTKRAIELDPDAVLPQLEAALSLVLNPTRLRIAVHPDDAQTARDALPDLLARFSGKTEAELTEDDTLPRGSGVIRTDNGSVNANIDDQLARIVDLVQPAMLERGSADTRTDEQP